MIFLRAAKVDFCAWKIKWLLEVKKKQEADKKNAVNSKQHCRVQVHDSLKSLSFPLHDILMSFLTPLQELLPYPISDWTT